MARQLTVETAHELAKALGRVSSLARSQADQVKELKTARDDLMETRRTFPGSVNPDVALPVQIRVQIDTAADVRDRLAAALAELADTAKDTQTALMTAEVTVDSAS